MKILRAIRQGCECAGLFALLCVALLFNNRCVFLDPTESNRD